MFCCKFCTVASAVALATVAGLTLPAITQPDKKAPAAPAGQPDDMMKEMQEAIAPADQHKQMARLVGDWDANVKMWMDPAAPPMESAGAAVNKAIMGGRYIEGDFNGSMMGMPFEGKMLWAFNKITGKYESTWIDNFGTAISFSDDGAYDAATKAYTSHITMWDPQAGKMTAREVVTVNDDNRHTMEMFVDGPDGKEFRVMEITYTRKGAKPAGAH